MVHRYQATIIQDVLQLINFDNPFVAKFGPYSVLWELLSLTWPDKIISVLEEHNGICVDIYDWIMQSNSFSGVISFVLKLYSDISNMPIKMIHYRPSVQNDSLS